MKKGEIYEGFVERLDFPNKGIVRSGDEIAVVKNTITWADSILSGQ